MKLPYVQFEYQMACTDNKCKALRIAQNKFEVLKLGWYCVRNRSTEEINKGVTISERHAEERAFFSRQPWSNLSKKRTGIVSLKKSLGELLTQHISHEFEAIRGEIDAKHEQKAEELKELGPARNTPQEQMQYLTRMATMYQRLADDALIGRRSSPSSSTHSLKRTLRTQIEARGDYFNQIMFAQGQTYHFKKATEKFVPAPEGNEIQEPEDDSTSAEVKGGSESEDEAASAVGDRDIYRMISEKWQNTRGIELAGISSAKPHSHAAALMMCRPRKSRHVRRALFRTDAQLGTLLQGTCRQNNRYNLGL
jgi:hypothetical protein